MVEKPTAWIGSSLDDLRAFPADARREAGFQLYQVQRGLMPGDWKAMPSVGAGVFEIRIHVGGAFRLLYVAKFAEAVYVLHAFEKRRQQTPKADLDLARRRLAALVAWRRSIHEGGARS